MNTEQVLLLGSDGVRIGVIARRIGMNWYQVRNLLVAANLYDRQSASYRRDRMAEYYRAGWSPEQIARHYGCSPSYVEAQLRLKGISKVRKPKISIRANQSAENKA